MSDFLLPTFLRQTPKASLAAYFASRQLLPDLDIKSLRPNDIAPLFDRIEHLPDDVNAAVQRDFQEIALLAHKPNVVLLMDEVRNVRPDLVDDVLGIENSHGLAAWFYLHADPDLVPIRENCLRIARVRELSFTKAKRRKGLPNSEPRTDAETLARMADAISLLFRQQGRGRRCVVEHYRQLRPVAHIFAAFPEDFPQARAEFESEGLRWPSRRPALHVALVYRPEEGILDVSAPGKKKDVDALYGVFMATALAWTGPVPQHSERCFRLQHLLDPSSGFPTDPVDGIERVDVVAMHLERRGSSQEVEVSDEPLPLPVFHQRLADTLKFSLDEARVVGVKLRVSWFAPDTGKAKTATFSLGHPDTHDLRDLPEHRVIRRYLDRWGLQE